MSPTTAPVSEGDSKRPRPRSWLRWCLFAYLILLTYVLLSPEPFAWLKSPSSGPPKPLPAYLAWLENDKVRHYIAYGILTGLLFASTGWGAAAVLAAAAFHGGAMEVLQEWFPPRSMELMDWLADVGGAITVVLLHRLLPRRRSD